MPEFIALVESLNQKIDKLEEDLQSNQEALNGLVAKLPEDYIPRDEADEKAERLRDIGVFLGTILLIVGLSIVGLVFWVKGEVKKESEARCRASRAALAEVVNVAVADRQPLPTSTPETIAAIERLNDEVTRPLRNRLLSLDGTQPEKC